MGIERKLKDMRFSSLPSKEESSFLMLFLSMKMIPKEKIMNRRRSDYWQFVITGAQWKKLCSLVRVRAFVTIWSDETNDKRKITRTSSSVCRKNFHSNAFFRYSELLFSTVEKETSFAAYIIPSADFAFSIVMVTLLFILFVSVFLFFFDVFQEREKYTYIYILCICICIRMHICNIYINMRISYIIYWYI